MNLTSIVILNFASNKAVDLAAHLGVDLASLRVGRGVTYSPGRKKRRVKYPMVVMVMVMVVMVMVVMVMAVMVMVVEMTIVKRGLIECMKYKKFTSLCISILHILILA